MKFLEINSIVKIYLPFNIILFGKVIEYENNQLVLKTADGHICYVPDITNIITLIILNNDQSQDIINNNLDLSNLQLDNNLKSEDNSIEKKQKLKMFVNKRADADKKKIKHMFENFNFGLNEGNYELPNFKK